jgi:hypothetical protein
MQDRARRKFRLLCIVIGVLVFAAASDAAYPMARSLFAHKPPPFSFWYFESLPEQERTDAATKYLKEKYPTGSDASAIFIELERAGAKCSERPYPAFHSKRGNSSRNCNFDRIGSPFSPVQWGVTLDIGSNNKMEYVAAWRQPEDGVLGMMYWAIFPRHIKENTEMH